MRAANRLPSPPGVALRVLELAREENSSPSDVADVLSLDPALSARVLKFVNSPMVGLEQKISSLKQAVSLIGMRAAKMMALSFSLVSSEKRASCPSFDYGRFWSRSLVSAVTARIIARATKKHDAEEAFTGGLLSRIGQLVLACGLSAEYEKVLQHAESQSGDFLDIERSLLGTTHIEVGRRLVADWQLPDAICQSIAVFPYAGDDDGVSISSLARILYVSDLAAAIVCDPEGGDAENVAHLLVAVERHFGINADAWERLFQDIGAQWKEYGELLSVETTDVKSFSAIQAEANERIAELSLATQLESQMVKERNEELAKQATTDKLTGLGNRAAFDDRLGSELARSARTGRPIALLLMDVDHFKSFNDTYGHQAGDKVLQEVASAMQDIAREIDFVARYGGEEFAVIAPECTQEGSAALAERLRAAVEDLTVDWQGRPLKVTISVGVALAQGSHGQRTPNELIALSDEQLYAAKEAGRNCCRFTPTEQADVVSA
ncbi:MAG: GGDEF domain-containing protein [Planctomycetes bacterium]|nr:GGDEF domain-containing protein [Planctomycetota bacterium]